MLKKILLNIEKYRKKKQIKLELLNKVQSEINEIDLKLKKLNLLKKDYEKLENDTTEFLKDI